jgi:hydrogenase maturation protease
MSILVAGMGNVLMGDDAAGPYVIETLKAVAEFESGVELADLGTPGLDLTPYIAGIDALILVDTVSSEGTAGEIRRYEKPALMNRQSRPRVSPHDPALAEALTLAELAGQCPRKIVLIGILPESCAKGIGLSEAAGRGVRAAAAAVLRELTQCGATYRLREDAGRPTVWWESECAT